MAPNIGDEGGFRVYPFAIANPVWIDVDGDGKSSPIARYQLAEQPGGVAPRARVWYVRRMRVCTALLAASLATSGCLVRESKYDAALAKDKQLEGDLSAANQKQTETDKKLADAQAQDQTLSGQIADLEANTARSTRARRTRRPSSARSRARRRRARRSWPSCASSAI